ncbi:DUF485 domain-containing protein [Rhizobium tubonense]|uniref:DUF485 domain-containing protein n=1 Tax=Rhizobium tubonense TaxID=484088 RepID=A0A2W4C4M2_9HYPH|nr:DUF485 domain-containing protein [Rhizobium tubonense]PZM08011.1 hypothetical protein CPY51_30135 [Rhizobium tubonense]
MDTLERQSKLKDIGTSAIFLRLSSQRNRLGTSLAFTMATLYFAFIFLVAFSPATLGAPIFASSVVSLGVLVGVGIMVTALALTAIYVVYATVRIDPLVRAVREIAR